MMRKIKPWIDEFIKILTKDEIKALDEANSLKFKHIPQYLYKYMYFDDESHSIKNIKNDDIWLSNPDEFNDPYDSVFTFSSEVLTNIDLINNFSTSSKYNILRGLLSKTETRLIESSDNALKKLMTITIKKETHFKNSVFNKKINLIFDFLKKENDKMLKYFNEKMQKSSKISCFSEKHNNLLMWSHYSNHHKGFCVKYLIDDDSHKKILYPVKYFKKLFDITLYFNQETKKIHPHFPTIAAMHKANDWSYEKEWRFILPIGGGGGIIPAPKIHSIFIGAKIQSDNKKEILDIAKDKGIQCYKMKMDMRNFKLIPKLIK